MKDKKKLEGMTDDEIFEEFQKYESPKELPPTNIAAVIKFVLMILALMLIIWGILHWVSSFLGV